MGSFNSDESGRWEVYVTTFPVFPWKRQVSSGGGVQPQWRADGRELFYIGLDGSMMRMRVTTGPQFTASAPEALFASRIEPVSACLCTGERRWPTLFGSRTIGRRQRLHIPDELVQARRDGRSFTLTSQRRFVYLRVLDDATR